MNETEQIIRAQAGDATAWHALVRSHEVAIFRLAHLLLRDADDAADVAQETFLRAFRHLDRFDPARPLRPWLLEITRNQCYNWRRAWRRRWAAWQRWGEAAAAHAPEPVVPAADAQLIQQGHASLLAQAVRRLPESDQEVIYLRYFLELSVEETAQVLRVAPGTVKSRLSRALARLRTVVQRDFPALGIDEMDEPLAVGVTE